jgi:hypothetical protein
MGRERTSHRLRAGRVPTRAQTEKNHGMAIQLGVFVVPEAVDAAATVEQIVLADELGLDVVGVQDRAAAPRPDPSRSASRSLACRARRERQAITDE